MKPTIGDVEDKIMRISLIDIDSKIPNLALMKLSSYHKKKGDTVGLNLSQPDKVYISCVFDNNKGLAKGLKTWYPDATVEMGGSGISLKKTLPDEIEFIKPDYDLYPSKYSLGYTTRGCIRQCPFCIVPIKEGMIRKHQHPSDFHDDRFNRCVILDNNFFASPTKWWKDVLSWFRDQGIIFDANQGLDIRILNEEMINYLSEVKLQSLRFAWDNIEDEPIIEKKIELLKSLKIRMKDIQFYVLTNFNTTLEQDLYRCYKLKEWGVSPYVMIYNKANCPNIIRKLQRWANHRAVFWSINFDKYDRLTLNEKAIVEEITHIMKEESPINKTHSTINLVKMEG